MGQPQRRLALPFHFVRFERKRQDWCGLGARRNRLWFVECLRTADESIAGNIKTQLAVGAACDADADAVRDFAGGAAVRSEPERAGLTQVDAVQSAVDLQCGAEAARAACQVSQPHGAAILLHERDAVGGFDRPDQNAGADIRCFARDVEHERDAISEIDVGVPAFEEQRAVARGDAPVGMAGGVADRISLRLDDAACRDTFGQLPHDHFAEEKTRELGGIDGNLCPFQHAGEGDQRVFFTPLVQRILRGRGQVRMGRQSIGFRGRLCHPGTP